MWTGPRRHPEHAEEGKYDERVGVAPGSLGKGTSRAKAAVHAAARFGGGPPVAARRALQLLGLHAPRWHGSDATPTTSAAAGPVVGGPTGDTDSFDSCRDGDGDEAGGRPSHPPPFPADQKDVARVAPHNGIAHRHLRASRPAPVSGGRRIWATGRWPTLAQ